MKMPKHGGTCYRTGRSDYQNQINNVLAFPGIFRGALDVRATDINESMKLNCCRSHCLPCSDKELKEEYIVPKSLDERVVAIVSRAVSGG